LAVEKNKKRDELWLLNGWAKDLAWSPTSAAAFKQAIRDALHEEYRRFWAEPNTMVLHPEDFASLEELHAAAMRQSILFGEARIGLDRGATPVRLAGCTLGRAPVITPAVVVTLATLGALEWLRRRKAEVVAAEQSGDYTTLLAEFVEWLRGVLRSWREATGA
jgi:hypothetical protein